MKKGFTLIELLIVVAIIAILAAIAVPNFLEAQTRSRVSRAMNDLRTISLAMESYYVDNGGYPASIRESWLVPGTYVSMATPHLTTPISYVNSVPADIFRRLGGMADSNYWLYALSYNASGGPQYALYPYTAWMTWSIGPDLVTNVGGYRAYKVIVDNEALGDQGRYQNDADGNPIAAPGSGYGLRYDPTNGTVSWGDIYRHEGEAKSRPR